MAKSGNKKPIYKRVWFWVLIVFLLIGIVGGGAGGSNEKTSTPAKTSNNSQPTSTPATEPPAFDAQKVYDEAESAIYGLTSMEYALGTLDPSYDSMLYSFVPKETLGNWDDTCQYVLDATKEYINGLQSYDELFTLPEDEDNPIHGILLTALINTKDKTFKSYFTEEPDKEYSELVKQLSNATSFKACTSDDLIKMKDENPLKAKETYKDSFVFVKGKVNNMDSNGKYIDITSLTNPYDFTIIQCYIKNDTTKNTVMDLKVGDTIIVGGVVTDVGELMGYSINMYVLLP